MNQLSEGENAIPELILPDKFRQNVVGAWGEKGELWLAELPAVIYRYAYQWSLKLEKPIHKLNYNYVAPAQLEDGTQAILKIGVPNPGLATEANALTAYDGKKAVRLLKVDIEGGALLIERINPGKPLTEVQKQNNEEATQIAAEVIRDLPVAVPTEGNFPTITKWGEAFQRIRSKEMPAEMKPMLDNAETYLAELEESKTEEKLLHGDLHYENILFDEKNGWVAIDPKGVVGDPAYEAARLLHNGDMKGKDIKEVLRHRIEILTSTTGHDRERIIKWGYVDCLLANTWMIEDGGKPEEEVFECAKALEELLINKAMNKEENVQVAHSSMQGKGVFAVRDFKKGELVLEIDDSHVVADENNLTPEQHAFDLDYLEDKIVVMQSPEKFINHSCDPTTYVKTRNGIRQVVAMKDIKRNNEITYDYSMNGDNEGTFACNCGSKKCRGIYQGNFFNLPVEVQKEYLPYLEEWFIDKHQEKIHVLQK